MSRADRRAARKTAQHAEQKKMRLANAAMARANARLRAVDTGMDDVRRELAAIQRLIPEGEGPKNPPITDPEKAYEMMATSESDEMDFVVRRDSKPGETFSEEALSEIHRAMGMFVDSRIAHHWHKRGLQTRGPSDIHIEVRVHVDGESFTVPLDEKPWFTVDGSVRAKAGAT